MKNLMNYPLQRFMAFTKTIDELCFSRNGNSVILEMVKIICHYEDSTLDRVLFKETKTGQLISMSMRSLLNSHFVGDFNLYNFNLDTDDVEFNIFLKIVEVEDRRGRDGELIYPWHAYSAFKDLLESNDVRFGTKEFYNICYESGLIHNHGHSPKKRFTFEVLEDNCRSLPTA